MNSTIILVFLLGAVIANAASFPSHSLRKDNQQGYPHIVEYIGDFSLSSADLKRLLDNQFRKITISDITTTDYEVHDSRIVLTYDGSTRHVEQVSPLKVKVTNDSFTLTINFQAKVIRAFGSKNYSCTTKIPQAMISYTKTVHFDSGNTVITDFSSSYSSISFSPPTCKQATAKNDGSSLADAVNSTKSASLYTQLKKIMDKIQPYMSGNVKEERLSRVYDTNPYSYDFYGFKMDVSVNTIETNILSENRIENAISGVIPDSSFPAVAPPDYEQGYSTFYSLEFIKGAIEYAAKNYGAWREIKLNRNNMRTRQFRWRLLDFQYIVPAVLVRNPQSYLKDVDLLCELEEVQGVELDEKQLQVGIDWRCTAGFYREDGRCINFLSFLLGLRHAVDINLQESYLGVRVAKLEINKLQFDYIGEYEVIDPFTVAEYIKEGLFQFQVYTFGTFFRIQSKNLTKKHIPQRGIWIG